MDQTTSSFIAIKLKKVSYYLLKIRHSFHLLN